MIRIELSWGLVSLVDDDVAPEILAMKWRVKKADRTYYAIHSTPRPRRKTLYLHRVILGAQHGVQVDHIDGDGLNNQIANLRLCTHAENHRNARKALNGTSKFKGVSWYKRTAKWQARVMFKFLGYFDSELAAALAYDRAAIELFGPFARTNATLGLLAEPE